MAVNNLNTPGVGIQPSLIDAKGDLLVGTANDAIDRLGVTGPTGSVLVTDAGETTGLKWVDPGTVGGLVHINTTSFTSSSSESFNNVFSATYDNYKILLQNVMGSSVENHFRLRANGLDNTTNIYTTQRLTANNTTINATRTAAGGFALLGASEASGTSFVIELFDPFNTQIPQMQSISNSDGHLFEAKFSRINSSSSFDGFTIFPASSTFTGQISIYGYRKS
jgi:hypothetical protein